nr:MAG TPA: hypothetical protein [Caudoviricetes sp.]
MSWTCRYLYVPIRMIKVQIKTNRYKTCCDL